MNGLQKRFHLNDNTVGFHPQTHKLELYSKQVLPSESTVEEVSFEWSDHPSGFCLELLKGTARIGIEIL